MIRLHVGTPEQYGLPQARPSLRRGAPDGLRAASRPPPARRDHAEAEHRAPRRRRGRVRRRHARARRRRRLLHGLPDHLPVLRRGLHLRARQPHRAVPARLAPRRPERRSSSRSSSRSARSCRSPRRQGQWIARPTCAASTLPPATRGDAARHPPPRTRRCASATWPPSATRSRSTSTTTCVDLEARARGGRRARRGRPATRCRSRRSRRTPRGDRGRGPGRMTTSATADRRPASASRRSRPTARRSSPPRARCSPTSATARRACATSSGAPTSRAGRSTTTSPTRSRCSARSSTRSPSRRGRASAPRARRRPPLEAFVADGFRAYFDFLAEDPQTFELHAPATRARSGRCSTSRRSGPGSSSCARTSTPAIAAGTLPPHDTELMAAAMVGAAVEVGLEMVEREPIDADASRRVRHLRLRGRVPAHAVGKGRTAAKLPDS